MGNRVSALPPYSVAVEESPDAEKFTPVLRNATHPEALVNNWVVENEQCETCWDVLQRGRLMPQGNRPCMGSRRRDKATNALLDEYEWLSYDQVEFLALTIGSYLLANDLVPMSTFSGEAVAAARGLRVLGVYSKNTVQWLLTECACNAYGITIVPFYDTLGPNSSRYILAQTEMRTVVASKECLSALADCLETTPSESEGENVMLRNVILTDPLASVPEETLAKAKRLNLNLVAWSDVVAKAAGHSKMTVEGRTSLATGVDRSHILPRPSVTRETINTICYTSGTTEKPKGVLLSHGNFVANTAAVVRGPIATDDGLDFDQNGIHISYLPLAHVFERAICNVVYALGGRVGLYSGDTLKLLDDVKALRPTLFISVPRLFNKINDRVFGGIKEKDNLTQFLFNSGLNTKMKHVQSQGVVTHSVWDRLVFNRTKSLMGGRLECMISGGAPLEAVIQDRMKVLFCAYLIEGYGMTESLGTSFIARPHDPVSGHIGGPLPCIEFKLESVPEMNYLVTDMPPRGLLCLRGPSVTRGYFRNPAATREAISEDGWLRTGDIVVWLPNGSVKIIDRQKNIFKLAQGEYVCPERIENVYTQAPLVAQVFCFGYSTKFALVGIVVPDGDIAARWAARNKVRASSLADICEHPEFAAAVEAEMHQVAKSNGLKGFEKIKKIKLVPEAFGVENDLLTPTFKLKRHTAKLFFKKEIDQLYAELEKTAAATAAAGPEGKSKTSAA